MSQGPKKNVPILQKGGFIPDPLTLLAIRVVLLQTLYGVLNPLIPQLYVCKNLVTPVHKINYTFGGSSGAKIFATIFHCKIDQW